jgi:hypothetical protein
VRIRHLTALGFIGPTTPDFRFPIRAVIAYQQDFEL